MPNYNSIIEAIHGFIDKMIMNGVTNDKSIKVQNAAEALNNIGNVYLDLIDEETAKEVRRNNMHLDNEIADQLSFALDAMGSHAVSTNPLLGLVVDANISANEDLFGKTVNDLQSSVIVDADHVFYGDLKYVENYTGFSSKPEEQSGHYLAFHAEVPNVDGVTIKVKATTESTLGDDGIIVLLIKNKDVRVFVSASKDGYPTITKSYSLRGLVLENDEEQDTIIYDSGTASDV